MIFPGKAVFVGVNTGVVIYPGRPDSVFGQVFKVEIAVKNIRMVREVADICFVGMEIFPGNVGKGEGKSLPRVNGERSERKQVSSVITICNVGNITFR